MNITAKIMVSSVGIALAACGLSAPSDTADVAHAIDSELAKAQAREERTADAHAAASRQINRAAMKLSLKRAKSDYGEAMAKADREFSAAVEKCKVPTRAGTACESDARSIREQSAEKAKVDLSLADQ
jgi:hypothetical protein